MRSKRGSSLTISSSSSLLSRTTTFLVFLVVGCIIVLFVSVSIFLSLSFSFDPTVSTMAGTTTTSTTTTLLSSFLLTSSASSSLCNCTNSSNNNCSNNDETTKEEHFRLRFTQELQNFLVISQERRSKTTGTTGPTRHSSSSSERKDSNPTTTTTTTEYVIEQLEQVFQQRMQLEMQQERQVLEDAYNVQLQNFEIQKQQQQQQQQQEEQRKQRYSNIMDVLQQRRDTIFPPDRVGNYLIDMVRVPRDDFIETFRAQLGVPFLESYPGTQDMLLLYTSDATLPNHYKSTAPINNINNNNHVFNHNIDNATIATENCDQLHVLFTNNQPTNIRQCLAIVPNHESYHIHQLVRPSKLTNNNNNKESTTLVIHRNLPHEYVSRYYLLLLGDDQLYPPPNFTTDTKPFLKYLQNYLSVIDIVLKELQPILAKIVNDKNQIVVMMCNYGQSTLLLNFICTAKKRNLDISNIIVFTTDQHTTDLVTAFGVTAYYDQGRFGEHPIEAAEYFGDTTFRTMAMAKIRAAQLVSVLGYDFLFQDVDVVWFQSPLQYFNEHHIGTTTFDMYFQQDGVISKYSTPYGVNSGFYYARNNDRTQYFFTSLLLAGDTTFRSQNDQADFGARLIDQSSTYGLKVKVIPRKEMITPGGYQFHDVSPFGKEYMKSMMNGTRIPYVFHMSWTEGKAHKLQYLKQMGQWHVMDQCADKKLDEIIASSQHNLIQNECCSLTPLISCHYRDKPSIYPCLSSPPIDQDAPSWW